MYYVPMMPGHIKHLARLTIPSGAARAQGWKTTLNTATVFIFTMTPPDCESFYRFRT